VSDAELEPDEGWVDAELRDEFPELRLLTVETDVNPGRSTPELKARLRMLSDRFHGAQAITMRNAPVPHAYRVFFRSVGMDPDATRTPIEAAALKRLMQGGFQPRNLVDDAMLVALVETGVPIWGLDDAALDGPLGIRPARVAERLGRGELAADLPDGRIVVADASGPVAELFAEVAQSHAPTDRTRRLRLFSVQVAGVPGIHVEEALWTCVSALATG
jgi:DNA/RNA-binding domain of Phe-tRNA-synthetase-like protein